MLDPETEKNVQSWLEGDFDEASKEEVRHLGSDALVDAFYRRLEFGTGGLRGIMGVGTNRINIYTIRFATQGLANYLNKECTGEISVLIGFDSRKDSQRFAEETARVLAGNNIRPLLLKELRPVPLVSFGCRHLACTAAVLITASHNPPQYNGYKVYWSNGGQVLPPHDEGIIAEVNQITDPDQVRLGELPSERIDIDAAYLAATRLASLPEQNLAHGAELKLVYSSLHGTGIALVPRMLSNWGFTNVELVEPQCIADGSFPTVQSPNPEEPSTLEMGTAQMLGSGADLFIATDPDADRLGVVVRHRNKAVPLNGNEMACLCLHHLCQVRTGENLGCIKTIVTSELFAAIAKQFGLVCADLLTGFKYIGQLMDEWEIAGRPRYLFGAEESYGCLIGTHARDKDAISATALVCEMALDAKCKGQTLVDQLHGLYREFGVYREGLTSLAFKGKEGADAMRALMDRLRREPPHTFADVAVEVVEDYLTGQRCHQASGQCQPLTLPPSNVLLWRLADGTKLVVRPSGTEPKIKIYAGVIEPARKDVDRAIALAERRLQSYFTEINKIV